MPFKPLNFASLREITVRQLAARQSLAVMGLLVVLAASSLWLNLTNQATSYGNANGRYEDQIDSFSEYLVRNTVRYGVDVGNASAPHLYITAGYPDKYDYASEGVRPCFSNRGSQANVYTRIALALGDHFKRNPNAFFSGARFVNAFLISLIAFLFFGFLFGRTGVGALAALVFTHLSGIALFASNLYFQAWAFLLPLAAYPLLLQGRPRLYLSAAFAGSFLYFAMRYEFATTFALLWTFPVLIAHQRPIKLALAAFALCCAGFAVAFFFHHAQVASALGITLRDASDLILASTKMRTTTFQGVPPPYKLGFAVEIARRLSKAGISLPFLVTLPNYVFWAVYLWVGFTTRDWHVRALLLWAFAAYVSWYIFAYQHIMWHSMYDRLLFAVTIQLVILVVVGAWLARRIGLNSIPGTQAGLGGCGQGSPRSAH